MDVKINPKIDSEQEKRRLEYKPEIIRFLFVGESMPAGGTFFYFENSILYNLTKKVFLQNFDWSNWEFLDNFKANGFYLDDLCQEPINHLSDRDRSWIRHLYQENLAERLKEYNPLLIISTPKSINDNVDTAMHRAGLRVLHLSLPFPMYKGVANYKKALDILVKEKIKQLM
jgi:hypothetical protein